MERRRATVRRHTARGLALVEDVEHGKVSLIKPRRVNNGAGNDVQAGATCGRLPGLGETVLIFIHYRAPKWGASATVPVATRWERLPGADSGTEGTPADIPAPIACAPSTTPAMSPPAKHGEEPVPPSQQQLCAEPGRILLVYFTHDASGVRAGPFRCGEYDSMNMAIRAAQKRSRNETLEVYDERGKKLQLQPRKK